MTAIPFPLSSNPGSAPGEGSGRVVNCYAYKDASAARWRALPGLRSLATMPTGAARGALALGNLLYVAIGTGMMQVDASGNVTPIGGAVAGDGLVTMARNNNLIPDVAFASSYGAYIIQGGTTIRPYPSSNLPQVNSVTVLDGFFLWTTPDGHIWASDLNVTSVNALSVATAEAKPDGLLRGVSYGEQFFAFGSATIEVWQNAGASPFPLTRSTVIPVGLIGPSAVAGGEDGWGGPLIFVASDGSVRRLNGYTPSRISGEDLERLIARVADKSLLRACVYTFGGNAMWSLSSPDWTWEYNVTTGEWNERASVGSTRWRVGLTIQALGWWVALDNNGGTLSLIDDGALTEAGIPLIWGLDSGQVKQFPSRVQVPGAAFDFVLGEAALGLDPRVMLSWSHDGGATWANPLTRTLGKQGKWVGRVSVNRLGLASHHGIQFRFRVSDQVYTSFSGGVCDVVDRK